MQKIAQPSRLGIPKGFKNVWIRSTILYAGIAMVKGLERRRDVTTVLHLPARIVCNRCCQVMTFRRCDISGELSTVYVH